jgi:hypothetical protein
VSLFRNMVYEPVTKTYTDQYGNEVVDEILATK